MLAANRCSRKNNDVSVVVRYVYTATLLPKFQAIADCMRHVPSSTII
jgi:hypothetical protein